MQQLGFRHRDLYLVGTCGQGRRQDQGGKCLSDTVTVFVRDGRGSGHSRFERIAGCVQHTEREFRSRRKADRIDCDGQGCGAVGQRGLGRSHSGDRGVRQIDTGAGGVRSVHPRIVGRGGEQCQQVGSSADGICGNGHLNGHIDRFTQCGQSRRIPIGKCDIPIVLGSRFEHDIQCIFAVIHHSKGVGCGGAGIDLLFSRGQNLQYIGTGDTFVGDDGKRLGRCQGNEVPLQLIAGVPEGRFGVIIQRAFHSVFITIPVVTNKIVVCRGRRAARVSHQAEGRHVFVADVDHTVGRVEI